MSASGIDASKLPVLANAAGLETQAKEIRSQGAKIATTATTIDTEWRKLAAHFKSPDTATLTAALKPAVTDGDSVKTDADTVAKALEAYAKTERSLQAQKTTLLTDISNFESSIAGDDEWRKDEDKVKKQNSLVSRIDTLAADHTRAEGDCASAINKVYGGVQYRQEDGSGKAPTPGVETYGYTKEVLDSASGAGQTPWGKPAEWDKPWYRDVWDGVKAFGSGLWESIKGTVTGLAALANPFDWKTFSTTWKGVGTLALDVAVASSPVATVLMPERAAESRQRLKAVGSAMLNVEEWKRNPAKAAGMLTGDVLQTLVPGAGGARAAAMAGKAGKVVGRAGQIASKLGASERVVVGATNVTMKTIDTVAFKIDDVGRGVRTVRETVTNPITSRVTPQLDRARVTAASYARRTTPYVRAVGDMFVEPWSRKPSAAMQVVSADGAAARRPLLSVGSGPRFGPERDFGTLVKDRRAQQMMNASSQTRGTGLAQAGSGGRHGGAPSARTPSDGDVAVRSRDAWDKAQQSELAKKVEAASGERKVVQAPEASRSSNPTAHQTAKPDASSRAGRPLARHDEVPSRSESGTRADVHEPEVEVSSARSGSSPVAHHGGEMPSKSGGAVSRHDEVSSRSGSGARAGVHEPEVEVSSARSGSSPVAHHGGEAPSKSGGAVPRHDEVPSRSESGTRAGVHEPEADVPSARSESSPVPEVKHPEATDSAARSTHGESSAPQPEGRAASDAPRDAHVDSAEGVTRPATHAVDAPASQRAHVVDDVASRDGHGVPDADYGNSPSEPVAEHGPDVEGHTPEKLDPESADRPSVPTDHVPEGETPAGTSGVAEHPQGQAPERLQWQEPHVERTVDVGKIGGKTTFPPDGMVLDPHTAYTVHGRGTYFTDANGTVTHVDAIPKGPHSKTLNWDLHNPAPNTVYRVNNALYETDWAGRTSRVHIDHVEYHERGPKGPTARVGALGDPHDAAGNRLRHWYEGGHLHGRDPGGIPENINIAAMLAELNRGNGSGRSFRDFENLVKQLERENPGRNVSVSIDLDYDDALQAAHALDERVPTQFTASAHVDGHEVTNRWFFENLKVDGVNS